MNKITLVNHDEEEIEEIDVVDDQGIEEKFAVESDPDGQMNVEEEEIANS